MNEYLKKFYSYAKENLTMIAATPTIIGGVWQLTKLFLISPNMIRFFSISQLISDGISILFLIILPLAFIGIMLFRKRQNDEIDDAENDESLSNINYFLAALPIIVPPIIFFVVMTTYYELYEFITVDNLNSLFQLLTITIIIFSIIGAMIWRFTKKDKLLQQIYYVICSIITSIIVFIGFDNISKNLSNIENFHLLINKIKKENSYSKAPEILYFNDKYIFLEITINNKKSYLIKKTDDLFNN